VTTNARVDLDGGPSLQTTHEADVTILGGGLAGLTLALQIKQSRPGTTVAVLEKRSHPVPEAAHKVGESSLEIGADYFGQVLGLEEHIKEAQLPKYGLRFFVRADPRQPIHNGVELGTTAFNPVPSYQFDRGVFENFLARRCVSAGVRLANRCRITGIDLDEGRGRHRISFDNGEEHAEIRSRWVVDTAGRPGMLKRQLGLDQHVGHNINAAWFRIAERVDIERWYDDARWLAHGRGEGVRYLSTNHLMGRGYWVWLIPLSSGSTSIGIVADPRLHPLHEFNSFERALTWLARHEPDCAAAVADVTARRPGALLDFLAVKHYSSGCRQVFSGQRWAISGDAGAFLDPLYSPGSDFIAMSNSYISDLVVRQLEGEDVAGRATAYQDTYFSLFDTRLAGFEDQYPLFGNMRVLPVKVIWDYSLYWALFGFIWFNRKLADLEVMERARPQLERATALNRRMQRFLREWDRTDRTPAPGGFIDQSKVQVVRALNGRPPAPLGTDEFLRKLRQNLDLIEGLAGEIVTRATSAHPPLATRRWALPAPSDHLGDVFSALGMGETLPEVVTAALAS
jgi:flavin-dependent dehydrogenase